MSLFAKRVVDVGMQAHYSHTQIGYLTIAALLGACALIATLAIQNPPHATALWIGLGLVAAILALFSTLSVQVTPEKVTCAFGAGIIRRTLPLAEIESVEVVRNRWYYGWGLRLTPHGWLWNVSGLGAIELRLRNGRAFRIGSDEPQALADAVRANLCPQTPHHPSG